MAVTSVRELFTGREGGISTTETETKRVFRVTTNYAYDNDQVIFASGMLPTYSQVHPQNNALFARDFNARQENGAFIWLATVGYNNRNLSSELPKLATELQPIPTLRRVKVKGKTVHAKEPLTKAPLVATRNLFTWNGGAGQTIPTSDSPVESSSHEAFEGWERDVDQFVWEVTWNVSQIPFWITTLSNTMNNAPVQLLGLSLPKWSLKLRGFHHSDLLEEKVGLATYLYYQVQFELHYRRDLWFVGIPDRGYYKLDAGAQKEILLGDGSKPTVPVPLDGSGAVLASPTAATINYRWYAPDAEASFSNLPIPA